MTDRRPDAVEPQQRWQALVPVSDLNAGSMVGIDVGDLRMAVYNHEGQYYATHNVCTHAFALLTDGWFEEGVVECPLHAGRFDVTTGKALGDPVTCDLRVFETRVVEDVVEVLIPT